MKNVKENQCAKVLRYMQDYGSITPLDAIREFGILRLGARIWDLKNKFHCPIKTVMEASENRYGETIRYARYEFIKEETANAAD